MEPSRQGRINGFFSLSTCSMSAIPGGTADPAANAFLLEVRKLVRRAIAAGGGKLIGLDGEEQNEPQSGAA
jgi:hypothetical protein